MTKNSLQRNPKTGADLLIKVLFEDLGVHSIFGYPGGAILPIYDALFRDGRITHYLTRHEQAAGHAATGYARSTGSIGVVFATSGPGATNTVTALADAFMDSVPIVVITGQVPTALIGTDAFQEADVVGITRSCTKHNYLVRDVFSLESILKEAFFVAKSGRPGPVLVDVPKDIQNALITTDYAERISASVQNFEVKKERITSKSASKKSIEEQIINIIPEIKKAKKPLLYIGGGVVNSGERAVSLLRELVEVSGFPATSTLMALGCVDTNHSQFLKMTGMHGSYEANMAMYSCDLMLCLGARFDDRVTGDTSKFSPNSIKVHVDIDNSSFNKNIAVNYAIKSDIETFLEILLKELYKQNVFQKPEKPEIFRKDITIAGRAEAFLKRSGLMARMGIRGRSQELPRVAEGAQRTQARGLGRPANKTNDSIKKWYEQIASWRAKNSFSFVQNTKNPIKPQFALSLLNELVKSQSPIITTDVGQHQMWSAQYFDFSNPKNWLTSGGLGTMGYGLPAAVGAQVAHPDKLVICISGDASVLMNIQELSTIKQYKLPIKLVIINNSYMGMVKQWQEMFYENRKSHSYTDSLPNFVQLAKSFGLVGMECSKASDLKKQFKQMLSSPHAVVFNCVVSQNEHVFPMIPSGAGHSEILLSPKQK